MLHENEKLTVRDVIYDVLQLLVELDIPITEFRHSWWLRRRWSGDECARLHGVLDDVMARIFSQLDAGHFIDESRLRVAGQFVERLVDADDPCIRDIMQLTIRPIVADHARVRDQMLAVVDAPTCEFLLTE